jgi:hypothetical protein
MEVDLEKWLKPAEYFRRVHSGLEYELKRLKLATTILLDGVFEEIIDRIKHNLDELRNLEKLSDKEFFRNFLIMQDPKYVRPFAESYVNFKHLSLYDYPRDIELELDFKKHEMDSDIRRKTEKIYEKLKDITEDKNVKKAIGIYDDITKRKRDEIKKIFVNRLRGRLRRRLIKEVGKYDIDAFLIKQMLES